MSFFQHKAPAGGATTPQGLTSDYVRLSRTNVVSNALAADAPFEVPMENTDENTGAWTVTLASGRVTIPAGITRVDVEGQVGLAAAQQGGSVMHECVLLLNGARITAPTYQDNFRGAGTADSAARCVAFGVAVSPGDTISIAHVKSEGTARDLLGALCYFVVRPAATSS